MILFGVLFAFIFVVGLTVAFGENDPVTLGNTAGEMEVSIVGIPMTLQQAIDGGNLNDNHTAEEIEVNISGTPMTLQNAIDGGNLGGGGSGVVVLFDDNGDNETSYTFGFGPDFGPVNGLNDLTVTPSDSGYVITVIAQVGFESVTAGTFCDTRIIENGVTVATGYFGANPMDPRHMGSTIIMLFVNTNPDPGVSLTYAVQVDENGGDCKTPIADPDTSLMVRMEPLI